MSFRCGIEDPTISAWSPKTSLPVYLATSSFEGIYSTGGQTNTLDLNTFSSSSLDKVASVPVVSPAHSICWSDMGASDLGSLICGHSEGRMVIYDPQNILDGLEPVRAVCARHTGNVSTLDVNPFQKNLIASGAQSSEIFIWDLNQPEKPMTPGAKIQPLSPITSVAWNAKVQHILGTLVGLPSGTQSVIWDLRKNEPIIKIQDRSSRLIASSMTWNPLEPTQFAIGSEDDERPVIQLWDVRHAQQPYQIIEGHSSGISDLVWNKVDPRLLLSCGKDGQSLLFDVKSSAIVGEIPRQPGCVVSGRFCGRYPQLISISSAEAGTSVYDIMGAPSAAKVQSAKQAAALDDAFGAPVSDSAMDNQIFEDETTPDPLKMAPKWYGKKAGANFGFGGRLVSFGKGNEIKIQQVTTEEKVVQESRNLLTSIEQNISDFCEDKKQTAINMDKDIWNYIHARSKENSRSEFFKLLGIEKEKETIETNAQEESTSMPEPDTKGPAKEEEEDTTSSFDLVESTPQTQAEIDPFANITQDNAALPPEQEVPFENLDDKTNAEAELADVPDVKPEGVPFSIPTGDDLDSKISSHLMVADFEAAVECCVSDHRFADALIIAKLAGNELLEKIVLDYNNRNLFPSSKLISYINSKNWSEFVAMCMLNNWKHCLGTLITHCSPDELCPLVENLGDRMENSEFSQSASLCFIVAGNIDKLVKNIQTFGPPIENGAGYLQEMVEKILILRKTHNAKMGPLSNGILQQYAFLLSSQGQFADALNFLQNDSDDASLNELRDRLERNTIGAAKPIQTHAVHNTNYQAAQPVQPMQQTQPRQHKNPLRNKRREMVAAAPMPTFQPAPAQQTPNLPVANAYTPQPMSNTMTYGAPVSSQPLASIPSQPLVSTPMIPQPAMNQPNLSQPNMFPSSQPAPFNPPLPTAPTSQPYTPTVTKNTFNNPNQQSPMVTNTPTLTPASMPPQDNFGYGQGSYGPDISAIPTGPPPGGKDPARECPGWNDPRNKKVYTEKKIDSSMRLNKKSRKPAQIVPNDFQGGFVPAPVQNTMSNQMGMPQMNPSMNSQMGMPPQMGVNAPPMNSSLIPNQMGAPMPNMMTPSGMPNMSGPAAGMVSAPMGIPPVNMNAAGGNQSFAPKGPEAQIEPSGPNSGAAKVQKLPLPEQFIPVQKSFDAAVQRCQAVPGINATLKKKLDDANKRLCSLYDKLRNNTLSKIVTDGLIQIAGALDAHDYQRGLGLVQWIVQKANFSEVSSFLPGIKNLMQIAAQLKV